MSVRKGALASLRRKWRTRQIIREFEKYGRARVRLGGQVWIATYTYRAVLPVNGFHRAIGRLLAYYALAAALRRPR